jgi:hypothetical protein
MTKKKNAAKAEGLEGFVHRTISLPRDLVAFADERSAQPEHAGNFSSYLRSLIIQDRATTKKTSLAA